MIREVSVFQHPVAIPGICIKCSSQDKDWFVDIGCDTEISYEMRRTEGVIYLCCDCFNSLHSDVVRKFSNYHKDHDVEVFPNGYARDIESEVVSSDGGSSNRNEQASVNSEPETHGNDSGQDFTFVGLAT